MPRHGLEILKSHAVPLSGDIAENLHEEAQQWVGVRNKAIASAEGM